MIAFEVVNIATSGPDAAGCITFDFVFCVDRKHTYTVTLAGDGKTPGKNFVGALQAAAEYILYKTAAPLIPLPSDRSLQ